MTYVLFLLIMALFAAAQPDEYVFLANTWEVTGSGRTAQNVNEETFLYTLSTQLPVQVPNLDTNQFIVSPDHTFALKGASFLPERSTAEIIALGTNVVRSYPVEMSLGKPAAWSPDGDQIAVAIYTDISNDQYQQTGRLALFDVTTGAVRLLTPDENYGEEIQFLSWSLDGTAIAYVSAAHTLDENGRTVATRNVVKIADVSEGTTRTLYDRIYSDEEVNREVELHWLPTGSQLAVIRTGQEIFLLDTDTGAVDDQYVFPLGIVPDRICWSPRHDHFIITNDDDTYSWVGFDEEVSLDTQFIDPAIWDIPSGSLHACIWSPDGYKLALLQQDDQVTLIDFEQRKVNRIQVNINIEFFLVPYWSPHSRMLAFGNAGASREPGAVDIYEVSDVAHPRHIFHQANLRFLAWVKSE